MSGREIPDRHEPVDVTTAMREASERVERDPALQPTEGMPPDEAAIAKRTTTANTARGGPG